MLKGIIRADFNEARKSGDQIKKSAIESVLAAILIKEKSGGICEIDDKGVIDCLTKEIKIQKEIQEMYAGKNDVKSAEAAARAAALEVYLPAQLSEAEVSAMIARLAPAGDKSPKAKGLIMKGLMPEIAGRFDKSKVGALVEKFLNE